MFGINTSIDFYEKMLQDFEEFVEHSDSPRHAINCVLSAYHMAEWVWGDWLKTDYETWAALGISDKQSFLSWIDKTQPWFSVTQAIANGSKHFARHLAQTSPPSLFKHYDETGRRHERFVLDVKVDDVWWVEAITLVEEIIKFWTNFFRKYRPLSELPAPKNPKIRIQD